MLDYYDDSAEINEINSLLFKISRKLIDADLNEDDYMMLVYWLNQLSGQAFASIIKSYALQDILFDGKTYLQRKEISKEICSRIKEKESEYEYIEESYNVNNKNGVIIPFKK